MLRWLTRLLALVLVVALAVPLFTAGVVVATGEVDGRRASDVIVVLGAAQYDGRPQPILQARLDHAAALYRAGLAQHIITVGGRRKGDRFTEAAAGRRSLRKDGIPASALVAVGKGSDTYSSLRAAAEEMDRRGWCSALLVSDPWHLARSRAMADDFGMRPATSPVPDPPITGTAANARYVIRETVARLYYGAVQAPATKSLVGGCG